MKNHSTVSEIAVLVKRTPARVRQVSQSLGVGEVLGGKIRLFTRTDARRIMAYFKEAKRGPKKISRDTDKDC